MTGRQFFYIVIATFITIIIWVALDIVHSRAKVQIPPEVNELMEPIDPNIDLSVLGDL